MKGGNHFPHSVVAPCRNPNVVNVVVVGGQGFTNTLQKAIRMARRVVVNVHLDWMLVNATELLTECPK